MIFSIFQKNWVFGYSWSTLLWYRCYYPHWSRDALSPVCGIFSHGHSFLKRHYTLLGTTWSLSRVFVLPKYRVTSGTSWFSFNCTYSFCNVSSQKIFQTQYLFVSYALPQYMFHPLYQPLYYPLYHQHNNKIYIDVLVFKCRYTVAFGQVLSVASGKSAKLNLFLKKYERKADF